jgi:predicted metalloprotease
MAPTAKIMRRASSVRRRATERGIVCGGVKVTAAIASKIGAACPFPVASGRWYGGLGILVPVALAVFLGIDPKELLREGPTVNSSYVSAPPDYSPGGAVTGHDELRDFVAVALAGTEDTWREFFKGGC